MPGQSQKQRRVLMIAHAFPPTGGSGVQRPAKFAKYLPQFGWTPHVWTTDHIPGLPIDATLCNDLSPEVTIYRFVNTDRLRAIAKLNWRLNRLIPRRFPDDAITWARASVRPLLNLIGREQIDLIFSTYSPASCHWLALQMKRRTGLPWVADFRDLWTDDPRYRESPPRRAAHRKLEDAILRDADIVIGVTPSQTELLARRIPGQESKFITITNGFDPADFAECNAGARIPSRTLDPCGPRTLVRADKFVVSHIGRLDAHRAGNEFFAALGKFAQQIGDSSNRFILRIVGHCNEQTRQRLRETSITCEFIDYVTHAESIREMCSADALLLLLPTGPNAETIIAGKVFEYLAARRPILAIGPDASETLRIVSELNAGVATQFKESEIVRAFCSLFDPATMEQQTTRNQGIASLQDLHHFNRMELTRRLSEVFNQLVALEPVQNNATGASVRVRSVSESSLVGRVTPVAT